MRTLVILGGADGSVSVYQRARELGYRTICVDIRPAAPGVVHADEFVRLSVRAPEQIAHALAGRTDIVGVLCPASDVGLPTQAWLTRHWNLPAGLTADAVAASVDKSVFRALCAELGLPGYRSVAGLPGPDLIAAATELRFPTLVKPVDSSGSRGVVCCAVPNALRTSFIESVEFSPSGRIVVEEHLDGTHYTIEALVHDGRLAFHAVTERTITPPPFFVTTTHLLPGRLPSDVDGRLPEMLTGICAALGYRDGPLTLDAILGRDGELYLVEMSARMGGNGLSEVIETCYGVDLTAAAIALAVGDTPVVEAHRPSPTLVHLFGSDRAGRLAAVDGAQDVLGIPEVVDLRLFAEEGTTVHAYEQAGYKLGYVVLTSGSQDRLREVENEVRGTLKFRLLEQDLAVPQP